MSYEGLTFVGNRAVAHLGGNIKEGDPFTFSPGVWDYVINRFALGSILDLGSGMGYAAEYFFKKGIRVVAVDGMDENVSNSVYPTVQIDLTKSAVRCNVDLVHCQEVVEHVDEKHLQNVLDSLSNGQFILMTHALPGQGGHHHVNLQPSEYWTAHLSRCGYVQMIEDTARMRRIAAAEGAIYLAQSGLLFARGGCIIGQGPK
jgi:SAM-dependent methyltransferase